MWSNLFCIFLFSFSLNQPLRNEEKEENEEKETTRCVANEEEETTKFVANEEEETSRCVANEEEDMSLCFLMSRQPHRIISGRIMYSTLICLLHQFKTQVTKSHLSIYQCTCFGTYLYSEGTHHVSLLKSLATIIRATNFIPWAHTDNCLSQTYRT